MIPYERLSAVIALQGPIGRPLYGWGLCIRTLAGKLGLLFTLCAKIATQAHRDGAGDKLRHTTKDDHLGIAQGG